MRKLPWKGTHHSSTLHFLPERRMIRSNLKLTEQRCSACPTTLQHFNKESKTSIGFLTNSDSRSDKSSLLKILNEVHRWTRWFEKKYSMELIFCQYIKFNFVFIYYSTTFTARRRCYGLWLTLPCGCTLQYFLVNVYMRWDSSVVMALGYGLGGQGLIPGSGIIFFYSTESWQYLEPTHPHIQ
jgi:hypothetical protein